MTHTYKNSLIIMTSIQINHNYYATNLGFNYLKFIETFNFLLILIRPNIQFIYFFPFSLIFL